jgi:hypothetical protein
MRGEDDSRLIDGMLRKGINPVDEGYINGKRYLVYLCPPHTYPPPRTGEGGVGVEELSSMVS